MTPYADFLYFAILLYPILPLLILGLLGRKTRWWILVATAGMLIIQYSGMDVILLGLASRGLAAVRIANQDSLHWSILPNKVLIIQTIWLVVGYAIFQYAISRLFLLVRARARKRWTFYLTVFLALTPLLAAKLPPSMRFQSFFGFVGLSYITFRSLDAIISIQDGLITSLPADQYLAFLLFFPAISSGPVDRYRRFANDWKRNRTRAEFLDDLGGGLHRIFTGFLYKFILAVLVKRYWMDPVASGTGLLNMASYMYAYSAYLFFDFAGYSAFAVGVSYLFGIHTPENFNRPFLAGNIKEFWNRWHISLSTWFRDHIYMRFLLAAGKGHWFKGKYTASYIGYYLLFVLMALWHGFEPHYIVYGFYHGTLFVAHDIISRRARQRGWSDKLPWRIAGIFTTFNVVCFGLLLFSGHLFR
jgi:membrane protein involved in D-alanine export